MHHRPTHKNKTGISLAVQWLKLHTSTTGGEGLTPGQGTKILHVKHGAAKKKNNKQENQDPTTLENSLAFPQKVNHKSYHITQQLYS